MGTSSSFPVYDMKKLSLVLRCNSLKNVCFTFPEGHPLEILDLADNQIHTLPLNLKKLKLLDLTYNRIESFPQQMLNAISSYSALTELRLSRNSLSEYPKQLSQLKSITKLALSSNKLSYLDNLPFVEFLDISCNYFEQLYLTENIVSLNISFNRLITLNQVHSKLTALNVSGNNISSIPPTCKFENLTILDVSFNLLDNFDSLADSFPNLQTLDVSYNKLVSLPRLPEYIITVTANNNEISSLDPDIGRLPALRSLYLFNNNLTSLPAMPESIDLIRADQNKIANVSSINTSKIEGLQLSDNELTEIPDVSSSNLLLLYLSGNKILSLDISKIAQSLNYIVLSKNSITTIPKELFSLPQLQKLILSDNKITEIPEEIIDSPMLVSLDVSSNPISWLPMLPSSLQTFFGFNCNFKDYPLSLRCAKSIKIVNLSFNHIKEIPKLDGLSTLYISHNQLETIREGLWMDLLVADFSYNKLESFSIPEEVKLLNQLDVSHNKLKQFHATGVKDKLKILRLAYNPLKFTILFPQFNQLDTLDVTCTQISLQNLPPLLPREITTNQYDFVKKLNTHYIKYMSDSKDVGYSEMKGIRETMEDSIIIRKDLTPETSVYAVLDGHGGSATACYSSHVITKQVKELQTFDKDSIENMLKKVVELVSKKHLIDGCTLAMTIIHKNTIYAVNIGDSRILLCTKTNGVQPLSYDHKPTDRKELERIRDAHSFVAVGRTQGILALSRSIGDFSILGVSSQPDIVVHNIQKGEDLKVVICCDGVYDVMTNEDVYEAAMSQENPFDAALFIRDKAFSRLSQDNISSIVVNLY